MPVVADAGADALDAIFSDAGKQDGLFKAVQDNDNLFTELDTAGNDFNFINENPEAAKGLQDFASSYVALDAESDFGKTMQKLSDGINVSGNSVVNTSDILITDAAEVTSAIQNLKAIRMTACTNGLGIQVVDSADAASILGRLDSNLKLDEFRALSAGTNLEGESIIDNLYTIKGGSSKLTTEDFKAMQNINDIDSRISGQILGDGDSSTSKEFLKGFGKTPEEGLTNLSKLGENDKELLNEFFENKNMLKENGTLNPDAINELKKFQRLAKGRSFSDAFEAFKDDKWDPEDFENTMKNYNKLRNLGKIGIGFGSVGLGLGLFSKFYPSSPVDPLDLGCADPEYEAENKGPGPGQCDGHGHQNPTTAAKLSDICAEYGSRYDDEPNLVLSDGPNKGTIDYSKFGAGFEFWPSKVPGSGPPYDKYWKGTGTGTVDEATSKYSIPEEKTGRWPDFGDYKVDFLKKSCGECMDSQTKSNSIPLSPDSVVSQASCGINRALNSFLNPIEKLFSDYYCPAMEGVKIAELWAVIGLFFAFLASVGWFFYHFEAEKFAKLILSPLIIYIMIFTGVNGVRITKLVLKTEETEETAQGTTEDNCNINIPESEFEWQADLNSMTAGTIVWITVIFAVIWIGCIYLYIYGLVKEEDNNPTVQAGGGLNIKTKSSEKYNQKINKYNKWLIVFLIIFAMIITHYYKKQRGIMKDKKYLQQMKENRSSNEIKQTQTQQTQPTQPTQSYQPTGVFGGQYL